MQFLKESKEKEYLYYDDIKITTYGSLIDNDWYELPYNEWEDEEEIEFEYEVDKDDVEQAIVDIAQEKEHIYWDTDEELNQWLQDNYDEYFKKYEKEILEYFRESATKKAQAEYDD